jgi:hypothetical protein
MFVVVMPCQTEISSLSLGLIKAFQSRFSVCAEAWTTILFLLKGTACEQGDQIWGNFCKNLVD